MKSFTHFFEDIQQRRLKILKRRKDQEEKWNKKIADYQERQAAKKQAQQDAAEQANQERIARQREQRISRLEQELEQQRQQTEELQLEQSPKMKQKPFNVFKAREQAKSGPSHRKHVHSELSRKEGAEEAAHLARLKSIMSREE